MKSERPTARVVPGAICGAIIGALTLVAKRERSFMILLSVLLGAFVLYWTIAQLRGH